MIVPLFLVNNRQSVEPLRPRQLTTVAWASAITVMGSSDPLRVGESVLLLVTRLLDLLEELTTVELRLNLASPDCGWCS
jgi:hypothetical protein